MKITIVIENCDTIDNFLGHLSKIKEDTKKLSKKLKLNTQEDDFPKGINLYDSNCYGEHYVTIQI